MSTQWKMLMVVGCIAIGLIYLMCRERLPDLHGMTIEDADAFLEQQNGKYALGRQTGFIEPKPGQIRLLGKIAEQTYRPAPQPDEPGVFDYKLYQIDVDKLDQYVAAVQSSQAGGEAALDDLDMSEFAKQMEEFKLLAEELAKSQPVAPEPIMFPPAPPPPPPRERRERRPPPRKPRIMEFGFAAPRTTANPLRLSVPDRVNSHKVHKSKESFFW